MNEQVFISYSSKDREWAEEMARILKENGIGYWKAPESIPPGGNYNIEIPKGIEHCPIFLVLLSENAAASEYVPNELDLAKTEHKYIIPVQISEYDPYVFKLALVNKQVYPWKDMDRIINQIRQQLRTPHAAVGRPLSVSEKRQSSAYSHAAGTNFADASQPNGANFGGQPPKWIKWAIAVCVVAVLGVAAYMGLSGLAGKDSTAGSFGGGRNKDSAASAAPADEPEENSEAVVSAAPAPDSDKPIKLSKMQMMESERAYVQEEITNSVGQVCKDAVLIDYNVGEPYVSYYLGGEYSWFTGTLSCSNDMGSGYSFKFYIYLDGNQDEPVFELEMNRATPPTPLEIDVTGCQSITFRTKRMRDGFEDIGAIISNGMLYGKDADLSVIQTATAQSAASEAVPEIKKPVKISKMHMMESERAYVQEEITNSVGQVCKDAVLIDYNVGEPYVSYYLGREYGQFTGTLSCSNDMGSGYSFKFFIYLDGNQDEPVFELEMNRATPPTPLEIDVTGCQSFTFQTKRMRNSFEDIGAIISGGLFTP